MQWVTAKKELINSKSNVANVKTTTCFFYILTICTPRNTVAKGCGNLAASIGSITLQESYFLYIIFWPGGLLIFYDPFLIKVGQPEQ